MQLCRRQQVLVQALMLMIRPEASTVDIIIPIINERCSMLDVRRRLAPYMTCWRR